MFARNSRDFQRLTVGALLFSLLLSACLPFVYPWEEDRPPAPPIATNTPDFSAAEATLTAEAGAVATFVAQTGTPGPTPDPFGAQDPEKDLRDCATWADLQTQELETIDLASAGVERVGDLLRFTLFFWLFDLGMDPILVTLNFNRPDYPLPAQDPSSALVGTTNAQAHFFYSGADSFEGGWQDFDGATWIVDSTRTFTAVKASATEVQMDLPADWFPALGVGTTWYALASTMDGLRCDAAGLMADTNLPALQLPSTP